MGVIIIDGLLAVLTTFIEDTIEPEFLFPYITIVKFRKGIPYPFEGDIGKSIPYWVLKSFPYLVLISA